MHLSRTLPLAIGRAMGLLEVTPHVPHTQCIFGMGYVWRTP